MALRGGNPWELLIYAPGNPFFPTLRPFDAGSTPTAVWSPDPAATLPAALRSGHRRGAALSPFLDWYLEQWWITPRALNFGNITREIEREFTIFSTHIATHTFDALDLSPIQPGVEHETIAFPVAIAPFTTFRFNVIASPDGLSTFDEFIPFEFDNAAPLVRFTAARVTAWNIEPNWIEPFLERQLYATDVIEAEDGTEQRIAMRGNPRLEWEFTFDVDGAELQSYVNRIYRRGATTWLVPVFTDFHELTAPLAQGVSEIPVDFAHDLAFVVGRSAVLMLNGRTEAVPITGITSTSILIDGVTAEAWPAGTRVYPAFVCHMLDPRQTGALLRHYARGVVVFRTLYEIEGEPLTETQYRSQPVMEIEPNWIEEPTIDYQRRLLELDPDTGLDYRLDRAGVPAPAIAFRWTELARAGVDYVRRWLRSRRGKQQGIWLPTWMADITLVETLTSGNTTLTVAACGLVSLDIPDVHRRDIRIQLVDGSVYYRRVVSTNTIDEDRETMTVDSGIAFDVEPADVERISWMHFARLDSDVIDLSFQTPGTVELQMRMRAPRNDL